MAKVTGSLHSKINGKMFSTKTFQIIGKGQDYEDITIRNDLVIPVPNGKTFLGGVIEFVFLYPNPFFGSATTYFPIRINKTARYFNSFSCVAKFKTTKMYRRLKVAILLRTIAGTAHNIANAVVPYLVVDLGGGVISGIRMHSTRASPTTNPRHTCPLPCMPPTTHAPCHTCPPPHMPHHVCPLPVVRMTNNCENIAFPQLLLRTVTSLSQFHVCNRSSTKFSVMSVILFRGVPCDHYS